MKFDKEALVKQRFWFLLGFAVLLCLVTVIVLKFSGPAAVAAKRDLYDKAKKEIEGALAKGPKSKNFLPPWEKYGSAFRERKEGVWKDVWNVQKDMVTWPEGMQQVLYPTDPITPEQRTAYQSEGYAAQFNDLER